ASGSSASHNLAAVGISHTISPAPTPYGPNPLTTSPEDADDDGIPDLIERAFGLNPRTGNSSDLPQLRQINGQMEFRFTPPADIRGFKYGAEWSETMQPDDWTELPNTGTNREHLYLIPNTRSGFVRLRVTAE